MNCKRSINNHYLYCLLIGVSLILLKPVTLHAEPLQNNTITGTVVSATDGEPLIGVSIFVKGTNNGTVTDIDGNYSINVNTGQTLVFSYIGFISQEVTVRGINCNRLWRTGKEIIYRGNHSGKRRRTE